MEPDLETMNFQSNLANYRSNTSTMDMDTNQVSTNNVKEIYGQLKQKSSQLNSLLA